MSEGAWMLEEGARLHEDVQGNHVIVINNRTIPCSASGLSAGISLGIGPPTEEISRTVLIRKSEWKTHTADQTELDDAEDTGDNADVPPKAGMQAQFQQRDYEVESVETDVTGVFWRLRMISPNS